MGRMMQLRWPRNAETARGDTISAAQEALRLLREARRSLRTNEDLAEIQIADAMTLLEYIQRRMVEAKVGADNAQPDADQASG